MKSDHPKPEPPGDMDLAAAAPPAEIPDGEDEGETGRGSGGIQLGSREPASAAPGGTLALAMPICDLHGGI